MSIFGGYPLLTATVAAAALLTSCGQADAPAPPERPPTTDLSIVVTVEYYDPEESPEVEELPVAAETPEGEHSPADPEIPAAADVPDFSERDRVFFVFDSAAIQDDQRTVIQEWGDWLKAHPGWALRIEGHADQQGPCLYNRWLGQQRANAARDILVERGIDASRLLAVSFGEDRPAIPGASRAERSRNRRVLAEPMRLAELEGYVSDHPPCTANVMARPPAGTD